jgi:cellulose biosynthesis protein BcsQ
MLWLPIAVVSEEGITIPLEVLYKLVAAIIAALLFLALKKFWPHIYAHFSSVWRLRRAEQALDEKSPGLWLAPSIKIEPPENYERLIRNSKPIIVVANLKGGVGKTTTVANLIGHYGNAKGKRVLAIDLDFQGSLSAILLSDADHKNALGEQADGRPSKAAQLVSGREGGWVLNTTEAVLEVDKARCVPSYYSLSTTENQVMVEWLIAKRTDDIRYSLARTLHSPEIQGRFDIVIIDAPPRLTTSSVQALCAATHVLIPTILDGLSAEATGGFIDQLCTNHSIWPHLKLLGAFGNMTDNLTADLSGGPIDGSLRDFEAEAHTTLRDAIHAALEKAGPSLRAVQGSAVFPETCFIPQKTVLGREAGDRIGYRRTGGTQAVQEVSRAFDRLGDEIDRRISATNGV